MTFYDRPRNCRKKENGCHLKTINIIVTLYFMYIPGAHVHICQRYEVSMIKHVARRCSYRRQWWQWQQHMTNNLPFTHLCGHIKILTNEPNMTIYLYVIGFLDCLYLTTIMTSTNFKYKTGFLQNSHIHWNPTVHDMYNIYILLIQTSFAKLQCSDWHVDNGFCSI